MHHSSASLLLEATSDTYKVSKLLIVTTQRYAKMIDDSLLDSVNSI